MEVEKMSRVKIELGKVDLYGTGKRYPATIEMELRERGGEETFRMINGKREYTGETTPTYTELSICGTIWNSKRTDCIMGGQCLDSMVQYFKHNTTFNKLYRWWKMYHLNGMNAGTPEQTAAIKEWENAGNKYDYTAACDMLKEKGLYEIPFYGKTTGKVYNGELYRYGTGWVVNDIPENELNDIKEFIATCA
jgi:hypothetical protein